MKNLSELISLSGKVAVVTGGAVNIGRAVSLRLASVGAKVAVIYHSSGKEAKKLKKELTETETEHIFLKADLRREKEIIRVAGRIKEKLGRVDVLVNNSGVFGLSKQSELSEKAWDEVFDLNIKGLFLMTREILKLMDEAGDEKSIVNIASINGLHPGFGYTAHYDASKGAVIAYTRSLAAEVAAKGVRVNAVAPGLVDSANLRKQAPLLARQVEKRTPMQKLASPQDVANAVLFLASAMAGHITGETVVVDGGYLLT